MRTALARSSSRAPLVGAAAPRRATRAPLSVTCFQQTGKQQAQAQAQQRTPLAPPAPKLSKEEAASLRAFLQCSGSSITAAVDLPPAARSAILATIRAGLDKSEQDLPRLEGAMLAAEQLFHASGGDAEQLWRDSNINSNSSSLLTAAPQAVDVWQPIFASAGGWPRLLYIPVDEYFDMHRSLPEATAISIDSVSGSIDASSSAAADAATTAGGGTLDIVTELGPVTTHFLGTAAWAPDGCSFEYCIHTLRLDVGGRTWLSIPFRLSNELSFFCTTPDLACARSKLGGTMLLKADPEGGKRYLSAW